MKRIVNKNLEYLTFSSFEETALVSHGFSTRHGGVSKGIYESMNLTFKTGDNPENVLENFRIITSALGMDLNSHVPAKANHGVSVVKAFKDASGSLKISPELEKYDAVITNEKGLSISAFGSDCVIIYYLDRKNKAIGISHGGWRGTADAIPKFVIEKMKSEFGTDPKDLLIGISPSIGKCCFEVDTPVSDEFMDKLPYSKKYIFPHEKTPNKFKIDLWGINIKTLTLCGVPEENIEASAICTMCNTKDFFSHRKMGLMRGGNGGFIMLR